MEKHQTFPEGCIVIVTSLLSMFLAVIAVFASVNYEHPSPPACFNGQLSGAGFPVPFLCDSGTASSPTSSWGKVDLSDIGNGGLRPVGFTIDFLFYTVIFWLPFLFFIGLYRLIDRRIDRPPPDD